MPRHQGIYGQEWNTCQRCGFEHPVGMLMMQFGLRVCKCHGCYDKIENEYRAKVIAEKLKSPEGRSDQGEIFRADQEIQF